jgi:hypothetical protein
MSGFKNFILRGTLIELAVAFIMGGAFATVAASVNCDAAVLAILLNSSSRKPMPQPSDFESGTSMHMPLSPEIGAQIDKGMDGYWVQKCWVEMQPLQIKNGITQVRSRLLDFALNLRDKIGGVEEKEVKDVAQENDVPAMFHGAVFGDNAVVVIGDHNQTKISNVVKRGDFESLAAWLKMGKVEEVDIIELKEAIAADGEPKQGQYGERVKTWLGKMTGKAIDGSWSIGIGAAGTLLAEGLKAFFGW